MAAVLAVSIVPTLHAVKVDLNIGDETALLKNTLFIEEGSTIAAVRMGYGLRAASIELGIEGNITKIFGSQVDLRAFYGIDDTKRALFAAESHYSAELKFSNHFGNGSSFGTSFDFATAKLESTLGNHAASKTVTMPRTGLFASQQVDENCGIILATSYTRTSKETLDFSSSINTSATAGVDIISTYLGISYKF